MQTIPLCLGCTNPIDALTLVMEGENQRYCKRCRYTYHEKREPIPAGVRIWEETVLGERRKERVYWFGDTFDRCRDGLFHDDGHSWYDDRLWKDGEQCWVCAEVYKYGLLEPDAFQHESGAWVYTLGQTVWFPDCQHCRGGKTMEHRPNSHEIYYMDCHRCEYRFEEWCRINDAAHIRYTIIPANDRTVYHEDEKSGQVTLRRKAIAKRRMTKTYLFANGRTRTLHFWQDGKPASWDYWQKEFKNLLAAQAYIKDQIGANLHHFWS